MKRVWKLVFGSIVLAGLVATVTRFTQGLGAATNLSDEFPWGLWIGFDILVGIGLAAGGFVIAATVNIFKNKKYASIGRPAILTAFLGYLLAIIALLFDLGQPHRIWHPLVMGNPHSAMFEVAMCVMLYTGVLAAEFSPLVFKRFGLQVPLKIVRAIYIPLVILGVILSTLHQSSLGTLFIIVPDKLHALWYTPLLPVFFLISAIAGGLAMTILESCLSSRAFGRRLEQDILDGLARIIVVVLAVFLVWKIENLAERGALHLVFQVSQESVMFWGEMLLGVLMPMFLFMSARVRASQSGLFLGATLTILGFVVNRLNVSITGFIGSSGVNYIPSWMEFAVTASIVAAGFALFGLAVKHFDVFPEESPIHDAVVPLGCEPEKPFVFHGRALAALWGFLLAGFVIFAVATIWKQSIAETTAPIQQHHGITVNNFAIPEDVEPNLIDDIVLPVGQNSPGAVTFNHSSHVDLDDPSCGGNCHVNSFKMLRDATRQTASDLEDLYECRQCGVCHDGEKSFDRAEDCEMCHETD